MLTMKTKLMAVATLALLTSSLTIYGFAEALPQEQDPDAASVIRVFGIPSDFSGQLTEEEEKVVPKPL